MHLVKLKTKAELREAISKGGPLQFYDPGMKRAHFSFEFGRLYDCKNNHQTEPVTLCVTNQYRKSWFAKLLWDGQQLSFQTT